jgi:hypothetical protein
MSDLAPSDRAGRAEPSGGDGEPGDGRGNGRAGAGVVTVGLIAAPGPCAELAESVLPQLADRLSHRLPGVRWVIELVPDRLVAAPADLSQLIGAARRLLIQHHWQFAVCITDLPLQTARRPVVAHASMSHGVAVLSLPALGAVAVSRRASEAVVRLVAALLGGGEPGAAGRRVRALGSRVHVDGSGLGFVTGAITGNLRLLLGMLRANRPWRLALRLSDALVAALASAVLALVLSDIWRLADGLGLLRLGLLAIGSVVAVALAIIIGAHLWEHAPPATPAREQVVLFNVVTLATVIIGVLAFYVALFALTLTGAILLIPGNVFATVVGHPIGIADEVRLAWLTSSLATIGGALGAGLESDEAVREAAYGYQPDRELSPR